MTEDDKSMTEDPKSQPLTYGPYDAQDPPPMVFQAWATLSAKLAQRDAEARRAILDDASIEPALFEACNAFWLGALASQIAADNLRMAQLYANICVTEMNARRQAAPAHTEPNDVEQAGSEAGSADETAFMVALPNQPALPFKPAAGAPAAEVARPAEPLANPAGDLSGETQELPAVIGDVTLPFGKPDQGEGGGGR